MMSINTANTFSGHSNQGLMLASNSGYVHVNIHGQPESSTKPNPSSNVPFRRDPDFVDRDILAEVDKKCSKPGARAALVGLGGVGKSQLAIEYAYRIREQFPSTWVFWVHASNAVRFEQGYRMIADRIKLIRRDEPTADILQLVSNWLCDEANGRWIMILDNADDHTVFSHPRKGGLKSNINELAIEAESLSSFLPQTPNGSILVTSRSKDTALRLTGSHRDIIKVEPMDEGRALQLFEKKLEDGFDRDDAIKLLQALDYMPLAISQAAAYISQRAPRTTVAKYLNDFRKSDGSRANLLNRDAGDLRRDSKASNSIITTWKMSFEYIRSMRPSAARLLALMSFFDRQGIPESLLHRYDDKEDDSSTDLKDEVDLQLEDSDLEFEEDVYTLMSYSLITTNVKSDQFEMHRLVQFSTRKWLELNDELEKWKNKYIRIILEVFPTESYERRAICQLLFPHAYLVLAYRPAEKKYLVFWSIVLNNAGWYAEMQGNYLTAEEMNRRALDGFEKVLGKDHSDTLTTVTNLAVVLNRLGQYKASEEMSRRALKWRENALGKEHLSTLACVSQLADVLQDQGQYKEAEEMNRRALEGLEKALGIKHPQTLTSMSNLALIHAELGKYNTSEEMNQRALDGLEKALGMEHPRMLTGMSHLASRLMYLGKYKASEEMNRRALDGFEKALGNDHFYTLTIVQNLARVLRDQGKYEEAKEMSRRALNGLGKALGLKHLRTLTAMSDLAMMLMHLGEYKASEEMNRRALEMKENVLGKEHPETLKCVEWLAYLLHQQKQYKDATGLYERSCAGYWKVLGLNHPKTLVCFTNYCYMIKEMKANSRL